MDNMIILVSCTTATVFIAIAIFQWRKRRSQIQQLEQQRLEERLQYENECRDSEKIVQKQVEDLEEMLGIIKSNQDDDRKKLQLMENLIDDKIRTTRRVESKRISSRQTSRKTTPFKERPSKIDIKMVILGPKKVGKSCLLQAICGGAFKEEYISTIGLNNGNQNLQHGQTTVRLNIWDTAGDERLLTINAASLKAAHMICLVYDIRDPETLKLLPKYHDLAMKNNIDKKALFAVIANKAETNQELNDPCEEANEYATNINAKFLKTNTTRKSGVMDFIEWVKVSGSETFEDNEPKIFLKESEVVQSTQIKKEASKGCRG